MHSLSKQIEQKLRNAFQPIFLEIKDESYKHAGHNIVAKEGNTHFHITITSVAFEGLTHLQKHRLILKELEEWMNNPIHAVQIDASVPVFS